MTWTTHTVFNQPFPSVTATCFCPMFPSVTHCYVKAADGTVNGWRRWAGNWAAPNPWSWAGSPMPVRRNSIVTTLAVSGWMTSAFIRPGIY